MKRSLKKSISVLLVLVMLLTSFIISPMTALAAKTSDTPVYLEDSGLQIWANPENVLSQNTVNNYSTDKLALLGAIQPQAKYVELKTNLIGTVIGIDKYSAEYFLFLPSTADCSALKFWFNGTASIEGTQITSGVPTNVFEDINAGGVSKDVTFVVNGKSTKITVIKSGEVGTVYIDTASGSLKTITSSKDNFETGTIMVVRPDGSVDYCGELAKMSGRGNGTWSEDGNKNPYNIKLAVSTSLLGMAKAKKWCLLANAGDSSLVKNQLTYDFAKYIGVNFQPVCKPVDLYVNQKYLGSYNLSEKVEIKSNRINVSDAYENLEIANGTVDPVTGAIIPADLTGTQVKQDNPNIIGSSTVYRAENNVGAKQYSEALKNPTDITGGYLYELEISQRWVDENAGFCAYNRQGWVIKSADYATKEMVDYSYDLLFALGSAVYNNGVVPNKETITETKKNTPYIRIPAKNPAPAAQYQGKKWSDILDADSAVKYYWTQEFFKNMDSSTSSTYFYKDSDAVDTMLYAGPMWDMDNSIGYGLNGSRWGYSWTSSDGWYTKNSRIYRYYYSDSKTDYSSDDYAPLNFYAALATNCADFWTMAEKYWYAYIEPAVQIIAGNAVDKTGVLKSAAEYIGTVEKSAVMNALRFSMVYDTNYHITNMAKWFTDRASWIESQISKSGIGTAQIADIANQSYTGAAIEPAPVVTLNGTQLQQGIDYTLSYENNVNAGTAAVTVNGFGTYTGSLSKVFTILPADISAYQLSIDANAYKDMELSAVLINADGAVSDSSVTYQWYKNGTPIDGAVENTYITTADDIGSVITVTATGDGINMTGSTASNPCNVIAGDRPAGYTKTIAAWDYDYTADSAALTNADTSGSDYYYTATSGERQSTSNLYACADTVSNSALIWSGTKDLYVNNGVSDQSPILEPSTTGWGAYPYFETVVSTTGYEDVQFSARVGVTKKGPRDWKLQYSLDGIHYTDVSAVYTIISNKNMELAFDNVALADCANQKAVYIRIAAANNIAYNGTNYVGATGGSASVNNIKITGASMAVVTELTEPLFSGNSTMFSDDVVTITDSNGGADVYYSINGGADVLYTGAFNPFDTKTAKVGDTVSIAAYAKFTDIISPVSTASYTFGGVDIMNFRYSTYSTDVTNGAVQSTGGVYDQSGAMTAYTDGKSQYVPLWNDKHGAYALSPDDGAQWTNQSGFTFKVSTAGYENVNFSCMAYTTSNGPRSVTLQYSTDGIHFYDVNTNVVLPANGVLEQAFLTAALPSACSNLAELYIKIATTEDMSPLGTPIYNQGNLTKGNLYINNVIIAGEDNGEFKMPYTNKSTDYFGANGIIQYVSPDGKAMQYAVVDSLGNIVQSGTYQPTGIQLSTVDGFKNGMQEPYTVLISVVDDEDSSIVNARTYYYKGDTVVKFNFNSTTKLFADYVSADSLSVSNTSGANAGTLSMYIDAVNPSALSYSGTYGVKVERPATKPYAVSKILDNPDKNAYWLVETSTIGYNSLTLNLEQLSSNKGPRDWGVAYSLDGRTYKYVANSNARAISNDASAKPVETYGNLALPSECDNQEKLFIKVFVNGGETIEGTELDDVSLVKGNTGLNAFEISGIPMISTVRINTTVLETPDAADGTVAFGGVDVYIDGELKATTDAAGNAAITLPNNKTYEITVGGNGIVDRTITQPLYGDTAISMPVLVFDVNDDGYVNAKDFAVIDKDSRYDAAKLFFENFINCKTSDFSYK